MLYWVAIGCVLVWALFDARSAGRFYVMLAGGTVGAFFVMQFLYRRNEPPLPDKELQFNQDELNILRKYRFWFKEPGFAMLMCSMASLLQMSALIFVPWFLYQGQWYPAVIGSVCFLVGPFFRQRFDPRNYLNMLATKRPSMAGFAVELAIIDGILEKLYRAEEN